MAIRSAEDVLDELLVLQSQGGDPEAFRTLVTRWNSRFLRFASHLTRDADAASDVAQEAWMVVVRQLRELEDVARFKPWAYRIVAFKAADWGRKEKRESRLRRPEHPTENPTGRRDEERLQQALEVLPEDQRAILFLHYLESLSVQEVALVLGVPEGTVKSRLHHARESLKEVLERSMT